MAKADFPPILQPGIHQMTLDDIWDSCVSPLPLARSRIGLFSVFDQWIHRLRQLNVVGTVWLDGSFVTRKPVPGDLDCVLWHPAFCAPVSDAGKIEVRNMTDHAAAMALFGIDLYIEAPSAAALLTRQAYWRGLFGFQHDGRHAKGFVELKL
ncbi:MAG: hypothetical protein ABIT83_01650 [Massilia sp.]